MKTRYVVIGVIAMLVIAASWCGRTILFEFDQDIASGDLGNGYSYRLWSESLGILNPRWDPDHAPAIYYTLQHNGQVVVPTTFLSVDIRNVYTIKMTTANSDRLVCIYDTKLWNDSIFIIFDLDNGEAWPYDLSSDPAVIRKWAARYNLLQLENPELPPYFDGWLNSLKADT